VEHFKPTEIQPRYYFGAAHFGRPNTQIDKLAADIEAHGMRSPIVIDQQRNLVSGWRRLEAAKLLKMKTVPVVIGDFFVIIAAMREENANADPATTVPMTVIEKLKMISTLRNAGIPIMLARRHKLGQGKAKQPVVHISIDDAIQTVMDIETDHAYRTICRFVIPALGLPNKGQYKVVIPPNQAHALEALRQYEAGDISAYDTWHVYLELINPRSPQKKQVWVDNVAAIHQQLRNMKFLVDQLHTPPVDLTTEEAKQWGDQLSEHMKPLRQLTNQLRYLKKPQGEDQ
jgi:hypothetical protein